MVELYTPGNAAELAVIKSVLDAEGIRYFVRNEHFAAIETGPLMLGYNAATVMVDAEDLDRARDLVEAGMPRLAEKILRDVGAGPK